MNRILFDEAEEYHLSFRLRCDQRDLIFSDDLMFHTLELPKYQHLGDNVRVAVPLEKWLYFLKHAEAMEANELRECLMDEEFQEAVGVLEMISKSPEDRQLYEARMKFLHDQEARLIAARKEGLEKGRAEGVEEGRAEGSLVGKIQLLQQLLGEQESSLKDLLQRDDRELADLLSDLRRRLRWRDA